VLHYQELITSQACTQGAGVMETHEAKVLKVNQKLLKFWKESDHGGVRNISLRIRSQM